MAESTVRIADVMTRDVVSVTPDTPLKDVAALLVDRGISGLPVCDGDGTVVGVLSEADLLVKQGGSPERSGGLFTWLVDAAAAPDLAKLRAHSAGDAMTAPAVTVEADSPVSEAARTMVSLGVNRLPVVEDGRLVGIVTRADLVRLFTRSDDEIARDIQQDVIRRLWIAPERIEVEVEQGEVVLRGEVDTEVEVDMLLKRIPLVAGVVGVRSELSWAVDRSGNSSRR